MRPERYQPQLIEETEALLGTPYFTGETDYNVRDYTAEELGLRRFIYQASCRVLARARNEDRSVARRAGEDLQTWNDEWELTARKMAEIAFRYETDVTPLARHLALVNNAISYAGEHWAELSMRLHADQQIYMMDILASLQKPPRDIDFVDELGETESYAIHGTTIIAPTGFGKTRLIETCAKIFEPGKQLRNCRSDRPTRILAVSPSLILINDAATLLAQQLPDVSIGKMQGGIKQPDADIVLATIEAFNSDFEDGKIAGHPVDVVMVDEGHHLSEPQFRETFVTQWRGTSLVFTATPAYDLVRDVRAVIPHVVEKTNIIQSIEKGTLNDAQILTFFIDSVVYDMLLERYNVDPTDAQKKAMIREVIDTLVLEFVAPLLKQGRRGIIFCEQGEEAYWANRMAERLQGIELADGQSVRAVAMHSYANNQLEALEGYRRGKYDVITTVDTGREGMDASFDFVIVNGNLVSRLRGNQIVGRGTRVSERFPTTVYGQFSYRVGGMQFDRLYSIEEAFGSTTIEQGRTLRDRHNMPRHGATPRQSEPIDMSPFPDIITELLDRIDRKPIGETFTGVNHGRREVLEGMIPLHQILLGFETTEFKAKQLLRVAGYEWYGRFEGDSGNRRLVRYYTSEARDYLHQVLPRGTHLDIYETASVLQIPIAAARYVINNPANNITGRPVPDGTAGRPRTRYSEEEREIIGRIAKTIPGANKGDKRLLDVAAEFGVNWKTILKWAGITNTDRPLLGGALYLTAEEVATATFERDKVTMAEEGDMNLTRISQRAGVAYQVVSRNMTTDDWAAAREKRYKDPRGYTRVTHLWSAEKGEEIARRMEKSKARPLEAHLLPSNTLRRIIRRYSVTPSPEITAMLAKGGFRVEEQVVTGTRGMSRCLTWQAIQHLEGIMGASEGKTAVRLDYSRLPTGPEDTDPDKIAYAQSIQMKFLRFSQLKDYDTPA